MGKNAILTSSSPCEYLLPLPKQKQKNIGLTIQVIFSWQYLSNIIRKLDNYFLCSTRDWREQVLCFLDATSTTHLTQDRYLPCTCDARSLRTVQMCHEIAMRSVHMWRKITTYMHMWRKVTTFNAYVMQSHYIPLRLPHSLLRLPLHPCVSPFTLASPPSPLCLPLHPCVSPFTLASSSSSLRLCNIL